MSAGQEEAVSSLAGSYDIFSSLPEHKERVGAGNHRPGQLLIVMKQRTDSIFSSRKQEIFLSD